MGYVEQMHERKWNVQYWLHQFDVPLAHWGDTSFYLVQNQVNRHCGVFVHDWPGCTGYTVLWHGPDTCKVWAAHKNPEEETVSMVDIVAYVKAQWEAYQDSGPGDSRGFEQMEWPAGVTVVHSLEGWGAFAGEYEIGDIVTYAEQQGYKVGGDIAVIVGSGYASLCGGSEHPLV